MKQRELYTFILNNVESKAGTDFHILGLVRGLIENLFYLYLSNEVNA